MNSWSMRSPPSQSTASWRASRSPATPSPPSHKVQGGRLRVHSRLTRAEAGVALPVQALTLFTHTLGIFKETPLKNVVTESEFKALVRSVLVVFQPLVEPTKGILK